PDHGKPAFGPTQCPPPPAAAAAARQRAFAGGNIAALPPRTTHMPRNAAERQPAIGRARWVATLWLAISLSALAGEDRHAWPEGSAMHALYLQGERLEDIRAELGQAHAGLLDAFGDDPAAPPPRLRARSQTTRQAGLPTCMPTVNSPGR